MMSVPMRMHLLLCEPKLPNVTESTKLVGVSLHGHNLELRFHNDDRRSEMGRSSHLFCLTPQIFRGKLMLVCLLKEIWGPWL